MKIQAILNLVEAQKETFSTDREKQYEKIRALYEQLLKEEHKETKREMRFAIRSLSLSFLKDAAIGESLHEKINKHTAIANKYFSSLDQEEAYSLMHILMQQGAARAITFFKTLSEKNQTAVYREILKNHKSYRSICLLFFITDFTLTREKECIEEKFEILKDLFQQKLTIFLIEKIEKHLPFFLPNPQLIPIEERIELLDHIMEREDKEYLLANGKVFDTFEITEKDFFGDIINELSSQTVIKTESINKQSTIDKSHINISLPSMEKINDDLYLGRKEDNLFFVFERVDEKNISFWKKYGDDQFEIYKDLKNDSSEIYQKNKTIIHGFYASYRGYNQSIGRKAETWIIYASYIPIRERGAVKQENIEMACTVMTSEESPFVVHMGIGRSMISIQQEKPFHKGISVELHAAAANAMKIRYPDKKYMITVPLLEMLKIFQRALPADAIFLGDNIYRANLNRLLRAVKDTKDENEKKPRFTRAEIQKKLKECEGHYVIERSLSMEYLKTGHQEITGFMLKNKEGEVLLNLNQEGMSSPAYQWFFSHHCLQPDIDMPYVVIDLEMLAASLKLSPIKSSI